MTGRVLLVEDEPHIVEALSFLLEREGWEVTSIDDGAQALAQAARLEPDVIILDFMLPGRSGIEVLRDLRAQAGTIHTPVLMLTAKGQAKDRAAAEEAGVSLFMTKPFSNQEIIENVARLAG